MKNALIILFLFLSSLAGATTYYIDPSGNNANNGSVSSPWKTLSYACSKATTSGDIIHVNAGTFTETTQSILALGVSIVGTGVTSIIKSSYAGSIYSGLIKLQSPTGNPISGNQSISYIKLDGNSLTGICAISIEYRSNVEIHHCTIVDFAHRGIAHITEDGYPFNNGAGPTYNYSVNNSVHDCIISNCSNMDNVVNDPEYASVWAFAQQGFLFYNNTCTETSRPVNSSSGNGIPLKGNYLRGIKIHDNTFTKLDNNGPSWHFFLETWHYQADCEIYNNIFNGSASVDICDVTKGSGSYGLKIYNNQFLVSAQCASNAHGMQAIDFEEWGTVQSVYVYNNHFKNVNNGIRLDAVTGNQYDVLINGNVLFEDIHIYYNIFENIGATDKSYYTAIDIKPEGSNSNVVWNNINILNNVITAGAYPMGTGILVETGGTMTNLYIRNNIIKGANAYPVSFSYNLSGSTSNVSIQNNLFFQNNTNSIGYSGVSIASGLTQSTLTPADPLFVSSSDFHLQPGSPAIGKGIAIAGLTTDFAGNAVKNPPSIGAFESGSAALIQAIPVYQSSVVANATPSLIEMSYDLSLNNSIVPAVTSFIILMNSVPVPISKVAISGIKVQLTLSSAIKYGDIITVSYSKPATNALQTTAGGMAASISAKTIINNLTAPTKDGTTVTVKMTISPNHVHSILNVVLAYSSSPTITMAPEIIRISNSSGTLFIEKLLVTGVTNIKIPLNLRSGIYIVKMLANGLEMVSQKMIVY